MYLSIEINETLSFRGQPRNFLMGVDMTILKIKCCLKLNSARKVLYNDFQNICR